MIPNDDPSTQIVPLSPTREQALRPQARDILRTWLRDDAATPTPLDGIGRAAIARAAEATTRMARPLSPTTAETALADIEALAAGLNDAPDRPRRWLSPKPHSPAPPSAQQVATLVERIERERDAAARTGIVLATDRDRLADADDGLQEALHLLRALAAAVEAAMRELGGEAPDRAGRLRDRAATILLERRRDVLVQLAVTRQATMTLDLLIANQAALGTALDRARTATLSALRVAMAARQALAQQQALSRQTEALAHIAAAASVPDDAGHAQRMLGDAVAQARAALAAMARAG